MKIAVDAMGEIMLIIIEGVEEARDLYPDLEFDLYGNPGKVKHLIKNNERLNIVATSEEISMGEEPVRAIRRKKDSSIVRAATAVKEGKADAFFSAGNTGAILAAGLFIVGRIKGIDRPGLTSILPIAKPDASRHNFGTSILVQMLKVKRKIWNNMLTLVNSMPKMYWELRIPRLRY